MPGSDLRLAVGVLGSDNNEADERGNFTLAVVVFNSEQMIAINFNTN